jgi:hypothetical protein
VDHLNTWQWGGRTLLPEERELARQHAHSIADCLSSKVVSDRQLIQGEPHCPFKIPYHLDDFWFTIRVSDCTYGIVGNHKRGAGIFTGFCASLKKPVPSMTQKRVDELSMVLGVDLFVPKDESSARVKPVFLAETVRTALRNIDFAPVSYVFLNGTQIRVRSELTDPCWCAKQADGFRKLLLATFKMSRESVLAN